MPHPGAGSRRLTGSRDLSLPRLRLRGRLADGDAGIAFGPAAPATGEGELELEGLRRRRDVIRETRIEPETLRAPIDGVIAISRAVSGQVVQAQDLLFQIIDPASLMVEALVFGMPVRLDLDGAVGLGDHLLGHGGHVVELQHGVEQDQPLGEARIVGRRVDGDPDGRSDRRRRNRRRDQTGRNGLRSA